MPRALLVLLAAGLLAACGNERTPPPDVDAPKAPEGERIVDLKPAGVRFRAPGNWAPLQPAGRRAGGVRSGRATVAVWRYPRREELPTDRASLRQVRELLLDRIAERDESFELDRSRLVRRAGAPGIEVLGSQTIAGVRVRVRSLHLYAHGAEVVIDAYAPRRRFARLDRTIFRPLIRTLRLRKVT